MKKYIHVWNCHHTDGMIPKFFAEDYGTEHGENPYKNKALCEQALKDWVFLMFSGMVFIALGMLLLIPHAHNLIPIHLTIASCLIGVTLMVIALLQKDPPDNYRKFNSSVEELFQAFGITPSKEIGQMSREEFITAIAGSLHSVAKLVDRKEGFDRVSAMNEWKEMHTAALKWKLCKADFSNYFPKK